MRKVLIAVLAVAAIGIASGTIAAESHTIRPAAAPAATSTPHPIAPATLGRKAGYYTTNTQGLGQVRPKTIYLGGDPTGMVTKIHWQSWGGTTAIGTGISTWVPPNKPVSDGLQQPVRVEAFNLGSCGGQVRYRAVEWWFPQHGDVFDSSSFIDTCTGDQPYTDPPACNMNNLTFRVASHNGAAGTGYAYVRVSAKKGTCRVEGFPQLQLPHGVAAVTHLTQPPTASNEQPVVLDAKHTADFQWTSPSACAMQGGQERAVLGVALTGGLARLLQADHPLATCTKGSGVSYLYPTSGQTPLPVKRGH